MSDINTKTNSFNNNQNEDSLNLDETDDEYINSEGNVINYGNYSYYSDLMIDIYQDKKERELSYLKYQEDLLEELDRKNKILEEKNKRVMEENEKVIEEKKRLKKEKERHIKEKERLIKEKERHIKEKERLRKEKERHIKEKERLRKGNEILREEIRNNEKYLELKYILDYLIKNIPLKEVEDDFEALTGNELKEIEKFVRDPKYKILDLADYLNLDKNKISEICKKKKIPKEELNNIN